MTCDCEKQKEAAHNDDDKKDEINAIDCPEGQRFDVDKGECVDKDNGWQSNILFRLQN